MGVVTTGFSMSLDGFIAYPDDSVGELFEWYGSGDVEVSGGGDGRVFHVSEPSATVLREELSGVGAFVMGRRLYDLTNGWEGRPPVKGVPLVVVTHHPPADWPRGGVPISFVTEGIAAAVAQAKALAGDKNVSIAGPTLVRECLDAGLMDEIWIQLIPVALGAGIPLLAGLTNGPARFEDPEVIPAPRVTHLRYRVRR